MKTRLGIFGGTFDPPHLGHMILAAEAADQLNLDRVLWVVAPTPPHKQGRKITPFADRAMMVSACIADEPKFEICLIENNRPGPHYTLDTLKELRKIEPSAVFVLLIGGDSLAWFSTWHEPQEVLAHIDELGVMERPGESIQWEALETQLTGIRKKVRIIDAPLLEISSTEIRERAASDHHFRYYLKDSVYRMILNGKIQYM